MTAVQFEKLQEPHTLMYVNPRTPWISRAPWANMLAFSRCRDISARYLSLLHSKSTSIEEGNLFFARVSSSKLLAFVFLHLLVSPMI